jgi:hypothetical protein
MWVATGNGTNTMAYSVDGITWTGLGLTSPSTPFTTNGYCVGFNNKRPNTITFSSSGTGKGTITMTNDPLILNDAGNNNKLDIVADGYYNNGYTNFNAGISSTYF